MQRRRRPFLWWDFQFDYHHDVVPEADCDREA